MISNMLFLLFSTRRVVTSFHFNNKMLSYVILLCMVITGAGATYGVDVSQATSVASFQCLKSIYINTENKTI